MTNQVVNSDALKVLKSASDVVEFLEKVPAEQQLYVQGFLQGLTARAELRNSEKKTA